MTARITSALILSVILLGSGYIEAYVLSQYKWPTSTVRYYVNPASVDLSDNGAISGVQSGAAPWNASRANINLVYAGTTTGTALKLNYKNEVFYRNTSSGYVAETYSWWDGSGRRIDSDIVMYEGNRQFYVNSGCLSGVYVENVMAHEFGHMLGLRHSSVLGSTMYASMPSLCDRTQLTLSSDDISGIERLYPPVSSTTNTAPTLTVSSPLNGSSYISGTTINFSAAASDSQEGTVTPRIQWSSNLVGSIGTGGTFSRTLPLGTNVVTIKITDNGGLSTTITKNVTVKPRT